MPVLAQCPLLICSGKLLDVWIKTGLLFQGPIPWAFISVGLSPTDSTWEEGVLLFLGSRRAKLCFALTDTSSLSVASRYINSKVVCSYMLTSSRAFGLINRANEYP